jgi:hypothetical protein
MKKNTFSFLCVCFTVLFSAPLSAQIQVDSIGRVRIGIPFSPNNDPEKAAMLQLSGKYGYCKAGSKMTFGDFGVRALNGWNVFVGEHDTIDTDRLWLHGKNGFNFTYMNGVELAFFDPSRSSKFNIICDIRANNIVLTSDERLKEQIRPLNGSLSSLVQLNGVSYYKKQPESLQKAKELNWAASTEKEARDKAVFDEWKKDLEKESRRLHIGFLAQDIQKIYPELVHEDKDGLLSVDYIGLIPVLVESIKEQQLQIEELKTLLTGKNTLRSDNSERETAAIATINSETAVLYQNTPNPFTEQTEIRYSIPVNVKQAFICIFDMQGTMLKKMDVSTNSKLITIQGSEFVAGMYLYSLVADGKEVDTKRMILTK